MLEIARVCRFSLPYPNNFPFASETGEIELPVCDVEIVAGGEKNLSKGFLATVVLRERTSNRGTSIVNAFEKIATLVHNEYLTWLLNAPNIPPKKIDWIQVDAQKGDEKPIASRVVMNWDSSRRRYSQPRFHYLRDF